MDIFEAVKNLKFSQVVFGDVIQGCMNEYLSDWINSPERRETIKRVSIYRMKKCSNCHMNSNGWCDNSGNKTIVNVETGQPVVGCGCMLRCKTALLSQECPAAIWKAVQ